MRQLINDGWSFAKLRNGSNLADAEKAEYKPVDLPHDWLIWQENDLYESADVWYRRTIRLPDCHEPVVMVCFDGIYMDCDILLNGEIICTHPYGYTAFCADLTGRMTAGDNLLQVHIRHQSPNSRWYSGSGIYRDVFLVTLPRQHIVPDSLYIYSLREDGDWAVHVSAETQGGGEVPFSCVLRDRHGKAVSFSGGICSGPELQTVLAVPQGRPWSPEEPYLYTLEISYGKQTTVQKTGLRSVSLSPDRGFFINGSNIKLKGVCLHHDLGALGAAFHEKAARRQLNLMKAMGANAVRTSHNPPASKFLDLCDEMGMLVVDEAFDMWERPKTKYDYARFFPAWFRKDVASWIRRDRCHPSVIMWSAGNEIYDMHADFRGTEVMKTLAGEIRKHDPMCNAFVTFGCNYMPWEGGQRCAEYADAAGYNYGEKLYEQHHRNHPSWVIYGSETSSILSSRGIYHFPMAKSIMSDADRQCSALGNSNTSWGAESLSRIIVNDLQCPYSMGQFIWSGIDYIGEPTPYHTRSCYFGQADTACFPKDSFFLFQSFWTEQKMIHIGVSWDWNEGQMIDIPVMTSCYEAELVLNGRSMGRKKPDRSDPAKCLPVWHMPFSPGRLSALGYDESGELICEDSRCTPGNTDHFSLECEDRFLLSDGWDITFVRVTAEDCENHPVDNACDYMKITVSGGGRLLGTDNGDSTDTDGYKSDSRRLFSGRLLLIIGSNGECRDVDVHIEGVRGLRADLKIPVHYRALLPGISCLQKACEHSLTETVPARRLNLKALTPICLTAALPECSFRYEIIPPEAEGTEIAWQVTNEAGIESPYASVSVAGDTVTVRADGDGAYYLRGLCGENGICRFISQMEIHAEGLGCPAVNPFSYVSAGLYDLHEGEIGTGNEKGIAFSRDGESMAGFSRVDFGKTGSDVITIDIFALNSDPYRIELWAGRPGTELHPVDVLHYEKPSIWNVYQPETWKLPVRLTGLQTLCFRMRDKVHMKGFCFEKQESAWLLHTAASADRIYGDSFTHSGESVTGIGNNVTLSWQGFDFGGPGNITICIDGFTPLPVNTVSIRIRNKEGEEIITAADFAGSRKGEQFFGAKVPSGLCEVSFVFLPGSLFDFHSFRCCRHNSLQSRENGIK